MHPDNVGKQFTWLHGTNQKLNVGDVIKPTESGKLGNAAARFGEANNGTAEEQETPQAWAALETPGAHKDVFNSYAVRAEAINPTKEARGYLYRVAPIGKPTVRPGLAGENYEWSSPEGWRVTHVLGAGIPLQYGGGGVHYDHAKDELYHDDIRYGGRPA